MTVAALVLMTLMVLVIAVSSVRAAGVTTLVPVAGLLVVMMIVLQAAPSLE